MVPSWTPSDFITSRPVMAFLATHQNHQGGFLKMQMSGTPSPEILRELAWVKCPPESFVRGHCWNAFLSLAREAPDRTLFPPAFLLPCPASHSRPLLLCTGSLSPGSLQKWETLAQFSKTASSMKYFQDPYVELGLPSLSPCYWFTPNCKQGCCPPASLSHKPEVLKGQYFKPLCLSLFHLTVDYPRIETRWYDYPFSQMQGSILWLLFCPFALASMISTCDVIWTVLQALLY